MFRVCVGGLIILVHHVLFLLQMYSHQVSKSPELLREYYKRGEVLSTAERASLGRLNCKAHCAFEVNRVLDLRN